MGLAPEGESEFQKKRLNSYRVEVRAIRKDRDEMAHGK